MSSRVAKIRDYFASNLDRFLSTLQRLVEMETPSRDKERLDRFGEHFAELLRRFSHRFSMVAGDVGPRIRAERGEGGKTILVLGHMDTVWPVEGGSKPQVRHDGDRFHGPGVFDMKSGLCLMLFAFEAIGELGIELDRRLVFLCTPDEEIGSRASREAIEREAGHAAAVLVPEPPLEDGTLKTRRKGVGSVQLEVRGKESHAGIAPEKGVNAIHELALQIGRLVEMNDPERGITVNVDIVSGGTKENVVAGRASACIDFRAMTVEDALEVEKKIHSLRPVLEGAELSISGGFERPPMEETPESGVIAALAQGIAAELGFKLKTGLSGGGSDGSFTAALGIPTIDGLGLDGDGAHALHEHVLVSRIPDRGALLTELMLRI